MNFAPLNASEILNSSIYEAEKFELQIGIFLCANSDKKFLSLSPSLILKMASFKIQRLRCHQHYHRHHHYRRR
jgi:hypothetical protein